MGYAHNTEIITEDEFSDGNFFVRHWRGQLSLPVSWFLVGGLLSSVLVAVLFLGLSSASNSATSLRPVAFAWIGAVLGFVVIRVWAVVGIWRSAGRHEARGGSAFWGNLARVFLVLGVFGSLSQVVSYTSQAQEYTQLALGHDPLGSPTILSFENGGRLLQLTGMITVGSADRFIQLAHDHPTASSVNLDSGGGRIFEAIKIAEYVKTHKLNTNVSRDCESACTLILLAGNSRTART